MAKVPIEDIWADSCPKCSGKKRAKVLAQRPDYEACMSCGSGFENIQGEWVYNSSLNISIPKAFFQEGGDPRVTD